MSRGLPLAGAGIALTLLVACGPTYTKPPVVQTLTLSGASDGVLTLNLGGSTTLTASEPGYTGKYTFSVSDSSVLSLSVPQTSSATASSRRRAASGQSVTSGQGTVTITPLKSGSATFTVQTDRALTVQIFVGTSSGAPAPSPSSSGAPAPSPSSSGAPAPSPSSTAPPGPPTVSSVTVGSSAQLVPNSAANDPLTVTAYDSSHTAITSGSFANPFTLSVSDASGATKLSLNGGAAASSVTVSAPGDNVVLVYSGEATSNATIIASGVTGGGTVNAAVGTVSFPSGTQTDTLSPSDPNYNQPTVFFYNLTTPDTFAAQELGWTNFGSLLTATFDPTTCGTGASAVASITSNTLAGNAENLTVTPQKAGICKLTLSDGLGASGVVWISVTTASFGINASH